MPTDSAVQSPCRRGRSGRDTLAAGTGRSKRIHQGRGRLGRSLFPRVAEQAGSSSPRIQNLSACATFCRTSRTTNSCCGRFRRGIARLAEHGLTYDLLLHPRHLPVAVKLVREFPEAAFVLDHIAKPRIAEASWSRGTGHSRVGKIRKRLLQIVGDGHGGALEAMESAGFPAISRCCFRGFGPQRLMIGSDWPVCTLSARYDETVRLIGEYVAGLLPQQRDPVLGNNAAYFYNLE